MNLTVRNKNLSKFYENLTKVQHDTEYYLNPIGISRRNAIVSLLKAGRDDVVGDLGCGDGLIAKKVMGENRRVFGCDLSTSRARTSSINGIPSISGDVLDLPYRDAVFDKVICSEVLEHLSNPGDALEGIRRILRDQGFAVFTVPLDEHLEKTLLDLPDGVLEGGEYYEIKGQYGIKNTHLSSFTEESFKNLVGVHGFHVEDVAYTYNYTAKHPFLTKALIRIHRLGGRISWLKWLLNKMERCTQMLIFAGYTREITKHHIVLKVRKIL